MFHYFRKTAVAVAVMLLSAGFCYADYKVDDLQGPSGVSTQWVVINDAAETFGASHSEAIRISADLLSTGDAVLNVISGNSENTVSDRNLQTLFLLLSEGQGEFDMAMRSQTLDFDVSTPNLGMSTIVNENLTPYIDTKSPDQTGETSAEWKKYHFRVARQNDRNKYDTVIQSFYFQQNPDVAPSQGIPRPMIISNVYSGTAADGTSPLVVRMTLRDSSTADGNIIAYDRSTWAMTQNKNVGNNQWVFIPVDDLNTDNTRIEYYLTTEIANNTAYRYAARYPDSTGGTVSPNSWKFDIFRPQGTTNIPREIFLNDGSNIAPGLTTVYNRRFNINEQNKAPLHIFPIDTPDIGDYDLVLNHKILFGKRLGETYKYPAQEGRFNLFEVTAFQPRVASTTFYEDVARITNSSGTVEVPTTSIFSASSIRREVIADDVLQYFTINQNIPSSVRGSTSEGILPLHITFNIPVTLINDSLWWNEMLQIWRNTGRIEDMFANKYDLYLRAGENNVWNLTQELRDKGHYNDLIKVFFDENRGRLTQDNYTGVLTVSLIVMLMDGTRDGLRPELSIVSDNSVSQENNYIVVRDGDADNIWNMTFFIAPSGWQNNPNRNTNNNTENNSNSGVRSGGSGGGGCNYALGIFAFIPALMFFCRKKFTLLAVLIIALSFPAASFSADSSTTLYVTGTDFIASPDVTKEYEPAVKSGDEVVTPEVKGEVTFQAPAREKYTFSTVTNALEFAKNPQVYIGTQGVNTASYDIVYDSVLQATISSVTITVETGEITSTVDFTSYSAINDITITASPRTLTAPSRSRHFIAGGTSNVTFSNITFSGSNSGGGVDVDGGTVIFNNCTFSRCTTTDSGGAILVTGGTAEVNTCIFNNCTASSNGGGIALTGGSATITGSTFSGNSATSNGGALSLSSGSSVSLTNTTFFDNNANRGGAIYAASGLTIGAGVVFNNISRSSPNIATQGGAVYMNGGTTTVSGSNVEFTENEADYGGAFYVNGGTLRISGSDVAFTGNVVSNDGGAFYVASNARLSITGENPSITRNVATDGNGGAIYAASSATVTVNTSATISENEASAGYGGAIYMAGGSTVNLTGALTFSGNTADYGGAIYIAQARRAAALNITGTSYDVTFSTNSANRSGGAIYAAADAVMDFEPEVTFSGNTAVNGNGGAFWVADAVQLPESTIYFEGNSAGNTSTVSNPTAEDWPAEGNGGAIYAEASSSAIIGSTRDYLFTTKNSAKYHGGAICTYSGDITIDGYTGTRSITVRNEAELGGGFAASYSGTITVNNSSIMNQYATKGSGGVIWARNVVVTSSDFGSESLPNVSQGSSSAHHGGGAIYTASNGSLSLNNATFSYNQASGGDGGAVCVYLNSTATLNNSTFANNTAYQGGGSIYADTATVTIRNSHFHDNLATNGNGGSVNFHNNCTTTISGSTFNNNTSTYLDGGAVYAQGTIDISSCYFTENVSFRSGGAVYYDQSQSSSNNSSLTMTNSMLRYNGTHGGNSGGNGGGMYAAAVRVTIRACTFSENYLNLSGNSGEGGAVYINTASYQTGPNRIENCTFYNNSLNDGISPSDDGQEVSGGGALSLHSESSTQVVSCTFSENGSQYKGGAIYVAEGNMTISGTIVVGNTRMGVYDIWSDGDISSGGYNRIGVYGTGSGVTDFYSEARNDTDRTSYPSKGWSKSTFFGSNELAVNARTDIGDTIPPYIGSERAGRVRLLTLMLSEDAKLPLADRATNIIPYSRRTSFPNVDERGVSRVSGGEGVNLDIGAVFFDGTRYSPSPSPVASYSISRIEISGVPNNLRRVGQTASLIATIYYTNGRPALGGSGTDEEPVKWSSDKPNIIRINEDTGDITVLNYTPGNTYVTITVTTQRTDSSGNQVSASRPIRVTEYTYSYLNTSPSILNYLNGYVEQIAEYDISLMLADASSTAVNSSSFQNRFSSVWTGATASQVTDISNASLAFNTQTAYTNTEGLKASKNAGVNINFRGRNNGDLFPLVYSWTFSGSELEEILGYNLAKQAITDDLANQIFSTMRIDFQGATSSRPVISSGAVSATDTNSGGVTAASARSAGVLTLSTADGGKGLKVEMTAYLGNLTVSGNNDGSQLIQGTGSSLLVVPDGSGTDGAIYGTMWLANKQGAANNDSSNNSTNNNSNGGTTSTKGSGGGGGCNGLGLILPAMALAFVIKRR